MLEYLKSVVKLWGLLTVALLAMTLLALHDVGEKPTPAAQPNYDASVFRLAHVVTSLSWG